jgi:hypothetical protein
MKASDKPTWKSRLFGAAYERDERIKSAVDRAGNYSFCLLMFVLYVCMVVGLILKQPDFYIMPGLIFMGGCMIYLYFMVRTSAFSMDFGRKEAGEKYYILIIPVVIFTAIDFGCHYFLFDEGKASNFLSLVIQSLIKAILWVVLFIILVKILHSLSNRRIEKKISKD